MNEDSILAVQVFDQKKFKKKDQGFLGVINVRIGDVIELAPDADGTIHCFDSTIRIFTNVLITTSQIICSLGISRNLPTISLFTASLSSIYLPTSPPRQEGKWVEQLVVLEPLARHPSLLTEPRNGRHLQWPTRMGASMAMERIFPTDLPA